MSTEFRFVVDPAESWEDRGTRWDKELAGLQSSGLTVAGLGPDSDYPNRYEFPDGKSVNETDLPLDGPFVEVYETKKIPFDIRDHTYRADPAFGAALHLARTVERQQAEAMVNG